MLFNNKKKNIKDLDNVFQMIEKRENIEETSEEVELKKEKSKQMKKIKIILICILVVFLAITGIYIAYNIYETANEDYMLLKSKYRNELTIRNVDSTLLTNYLQPGKKTIVAFWASWCGHCQNEAASLNEFMNTYKDANIIIVSHDRTLEDLKKYLNSHEEYKWFIIYDNAKAIRASIDSKASSIPLTYLLDENGKLLNQISGSVSFEDLKNLYEQNNTNK